MASLFARRSRRYSQIDINTKQCDSVNTLCHSVAKMDSQLIYFVDLISEYKIIF